MGELGSNPCILTPLVTGRLPASSGICSPHPQPWSPSLPCPVSTEEKRSILLLRKPSMLSMSHVEIMVIYLEKERFVILSLLLQNCFLITSLRIALSCHNKLQKQVERLIIIGSVLVSSLRKVKDRASPTAPGRPILLPKSSKWVPSSALSPGAAENAGSPMAPVFFTSRGVWERNKSGEK